MRKSMKLLTAFVGICLFLTVSVTPLSPDPVQPRSAPAVSRGTAAKVIVVQATAYTHTGNRTYTETWPKAGRTIAVDPAIIPLGSRVHIKGVGWRIAEDKIPPGSTAKGAGIDIFMGSRKEAVEFGRKEIVVQLME